MSGALAPFVTLLDAAAADGRVREFWWRDDDAVAPGPRLDALLRGAEAAGARVAVAAIPARATPELLEACGAAGASVWQHGVAHQNHELEGKRAELGPARAVNEIVDACVAARDRLRSAAFTPVMVPPWNRMRADLAPALCAAGYRAVSCFGGPRRGLPLARVDTHIDPIHWRGGGDLAGHDILRAQAERVATQEGPIGLLTHHAVHTPAVDAFVAALAALVAEHPGGRWVTPDAALGL